MLFPINKELIADVKPNINRYRCPTGTGRLTECNLFDISNHRWLPGHIDRNQFFFYCGVQRFREERPPVMKRYQIYNSSKRGCDVILVPLFWKVPICFLPGKDLKHTVTPNEQNFVSSWQSLQNKVFRYFHLSTLINVSQKHPSIELYQCHL